MVPYDFTAQNSKKTLLSLENLLTLIKCLVMAGTCNNCFFFIGKDKYYILKGSTRGTQSTKELHINGSTVKLEILKGNQSMDTKSNYMHK